MREKEVKVGKNGIPRAGGNAYNMPSNLKDRSVRVRIYEWRIKVWYASKLIETLPRLTGQCRDHINYRHLIGSLLRKLGGFRHCRHRDDLFPQTPFHLAWEVFNEHLPPRKAKEPAGDVSFPDAISMGISNCRWQFDTNLPLR